MVSVGLDATYRTCMVCGQTGYVLPISETIVSIPVDTGSCTVPVEGATKPKGHQWGPYNPSPEQAETGRKNAAYTRLHIR